MNKAMTLYLTAASVLLIGAGSLQAGDRLDYSYSEIKQLCKPYKNSKQDYRNCISHYLADNKGVHFDKNKPVM